MSSQSLEPAQDPLEALSLLFDLRGEKQVEVAIQMLSKMRLVNNQANSSVRHDLEFYIP